MYLKHPATVPSCDYSRSQDSKLRHCSLGLSSGAAVRTVPTLLHRPIKSHPVITAGEVLGLQRETGLWPLSKITGRDDNSVSALKERLQRASAQEQGETEEQAAVCGEAGEEWQRRPSAPRLACGQRGEGEELQAEEARLCRHRGVKRDVKFRDILIRNNYNTNFRRLLSGSRLAG